MNQIRACQSGDQHAVGVLQPGLRIQDLAIARAAGSEYRQIVEAGQFRHDEIVHSPLGRPVEKGHGAHVQLTDASAEHEWSARILSLLHDQAGE